MPYAPVKKFSGAFALAPKLAKELHAGQDIEIAYLPGQPDRAIPVIAARDPYVGVGWFLFFAVIVFFLLVLSCLSRLLLPRMFGFPPSARRF